MSILLTKKLLFLLMFVLLLCSQSLYSQCKLERTKDDFSSSQTVYSRDVTIASVFPLIGSKKPWDLIMNFWLIDNSYSMCIAHHSQSNSSELSAIFFKFQDGTIVKKEMPSRTQDYNTGLGYSYTFTFFNLTKEELKIFASKNLLKFQADLKNNRDYPIVEEDIKKQSIDKIRKDANCILTEIISTTDEPNIHKDECIYEKDIIDDFTKSRIVLTKEAIISRSKGSKDYIRLVVCGSNMNGVNGIQFTYVCNYMQLQIFDQVDLLLVNGDVINLKDKNVSELDVKDDDFIDYKLFTIGNDSIWQKLKTIPLSKVRVSSEGKEFGTIVVDKKNETSIMNVINCIDVLSIPKSK